MSALMERPVLLGKLKISKVASKKMSLWCVYKSQRLTGYEGTALDEIYICGNRVGYLTSKQMGSVIKVYEGTVAMFSNKGHMHAGRIICSL